LTSHAFKLTIDTKAAVISVNIQNVHGDAKPYQVKQFLKIVEHYSLKLEG